MVCRWWWLQLLRRCSPHSAIQRNRKHCCGILWRWRNQRRFCKVGQYGSYLKLPVIFFIINNRYGDIVDIIRLQDTPHLYTRAEEAWYSWFLLWRWETMFWLYMKQWARLSSMSVVATVCYRWELNLIVGSVRSTADAGVYRTQGKVDSGRTITTLLNTVTISLLRRYCKRWRVRCHQTS